MGMLQQGLDAYVVSGHVKKQVDVGVFQDRPVRGVLKLMSLIRSEKNFLHKVSFIDFNSI